MCVAGAARHRLRPTAVTSSRPDGLPHRATSGPPEVDHGRRPVPVPATVIDHLSIQCADVAASSAFYDAVLATIGGGRVMELGTVIGYGTAGHPSFWVGPLAGGGANREAHIAFSAPDRTAVRAFFDAAVATGAAVLHEPRLWPEYHAAYYGAFVRDPDGNNVEAVCHLPA